MHQSVPGPSRSLYLFLWILVSGFSSISAIAQPPIINENSRLVTLPTGEKVFEWYGMPGRTYFIQASDENSPLAKWKWAPLIESGNGQSISHEVIGTPPRGFLRLKYSDQPIPAGLTIDTADFDNDGLTNIVEITPDSSGIQTDPLDPDTDHDGLTDKFERDHGLDPTDDGSVDPNNGPNGDPDGDGLSNIDEQTHGTDPNAIDTDGDGANDGDEINSGHDPLSNQSYPPVWRKAGRYIARDIGIVWTYAWWDPSLGSLHYEDNPPEDYAVILSQDIVFPAAPPSQDFFKPQDILNGGSCAYGVYASLDHTRFWLETKPALTEDYKINVIQKTERGAMDTFETTSTTTYESKVITIHANNTLSDPLDVLPTFASDYERVETVLLPVEVRGYATEQSKHNDSYVGAVNGTQVFENFRVKIEDSSDYTGFKTEAKSKLKIAQWGDYDIFDDNLDFVHVKFKEDLDIFRVRLPDVPIPGGSIEHRIKIWTTDKTGAILDSGAVVDLNILHTNPSDPASPVFHETPALALVADDETDDIFPVEGKGDGGNGDRTYRAVLGGKVKIQWLTAPVSGPKPEIEIPVPAERIVKVQGFLLKDTASLLNVNKWFDRAKKIYSAAGVDLDIQPLKAIDPLPAGVNLGDGFNLPTETTGHLHEMRDETKALMDNPRCAVPQDTIPVFFVNQLNPANAGATNVPSYMVPGEEGYGGAIFINSGHLLESVLAHELAHVLLDAQHQPSTNKLWNDIFSDTREKTNIWWGDVSLANGPWSETDIYAHRRLNDSMRSRIWKSRYAKLPAP